jgi:hypothetical protein
MLDSLLNGYIVTEKEFKVEDCSNVFQNLTIASQNFEYPIQRWYNCKEAFSINLLENILDYLKIDVRTPAHILDTYAGIGTTLLAAERNAKQGKAFSECTGVEINPFFHFVTSTKLNWSLYNVKKLQKMGDEILCAPISRDAEIPALTTLKDSRVFNPDTLKDLLGYEESIKSYSTELESDVLRLCLANTIEKLSGVRKDGRALRFVKKKNQNSVKKSLREAFNNAIEDLQIAASSYYGLKSNTFLGDGRALEGKNFSKASIGKIDYIQCSPPYLNNIDYSEVYKLELWVLKFINSYDEFRKLRKSTFRSHPSIKFTEEELEFKKNEESEGYLRNIEFLLACVPENENYNQRKRLFTQYFCDVQKSLMNQYEVLKRNGYVFWIVGNSLHGSNKKAADCTNTMIPIATDLLTAQLARDVGFKVERIIVTRKLKRRNHNPKTNYFLRESVIILKKL